MSKKYKFTIFGGFFSIGWLFTIGFLKLNFGHSILALFIWPYYIGKFVGVLF